jgi:RNA polymerase sigma-70 factor, ECF subfamily
MASMSITLENSGNTPPAVSDTCDDFEYVTRARSGDRTAEAQIYRHHARSVANLAARLTGSRADAEDIVQETFVIALERLNELRDPAALRPWLMRIAVSRAQRKMRRRQMLRWLGLDRTEADFSLDSLASGECSADTRVELMRIAEVLARCEVAARTAWMLHRVEGETLEATAVALDCSLATVKRKIAMAEEMIHKHITPKEPSR